MGWIARFQLASAVSRAGGFGMIETSSGEVENCLREIRRMQVEVEQPFGVNLPLLLLQDERMLEAVVNAGVRFVTTSAGNPAKYLPRLKDAGITVYHSVATLKMAERAIAAGVDGLVVEGHEGAGFKNPAAVSTLVLLRAVRSRSEIPMLAAGGIADGYGMAAVFAAGAEGVQMGTRFLASQESPVHPNYKQAILNAAETGTMTINENGRPIMRVLKTAKAENIGRGPMPDDTLDAIQRLYFEGTMEDSVALAGQSAGLVQDLPTVAEIMERIVAEFFAAWQAGAQRGMQKKF